MKRIYIPLFIVITAFKSYEPPAIAVIDGGPKFSISVRFGRMPDCRFALSICSITIGPGEMMGTAECFTHGSPDNSNSGPDYWELSISRESLTTYYPELLKNFEGKNSLSFDDSYVLPDQISDEFGAHGELKINAHESYPLRFDNGEYIITFLCR